MLHRTMFTLMVLVLVAVNVIRAEDLGKWKLVGDKDGSRIDLVDPIHIGSFTYARSVDFDSLQNSAIYVLEAGVAKPVLNDEGNQLYARPVFMFGGFAVAIQCLPSSGNSFRWWRLEGSTAHRVENGEGQHLADQSGDTLIMLPSEDCPYWIQGTSSGRHLYWFDGKKLTEIEVPYFNMPHAVWTGTQLVVTAANKTWIIKDGVKSELKDADGNSCMFVQSAEGWTAAGDYLLKGHLYRLVDNKTETIKLPEGASEYRLHLVAGKTYVRMRSKGGSALYAVNEDKLEATKLNDKLSDHQAEVVCLAAPDALLFQHRERESDRPHFVLFKNDRVFEIKAAKNLELLPLATLKPGPDGAYFVALGNPVSILATLNESTLSELAYPETKYYWSGKDIIAGNDGLYWRRADNDRNLALIFLPVP